MSISDFRLELVVADHYCLQRPYMQFQLLSGYLDKLRNPGMVTKLKQFRIVEVLAPVTQSYFCSTGIHIPVQKGTDASSYSVV